MKPVPNGILLATSLVVGVGSSGLLGRLAVATTTAAAAAAAEPERAEDDAIVGNLRLGGRRRHGGRGWNYFNETTTTTTTTAKTITTTQRKITNTQQQQQLLLLQRNLTSQHRSGPEGCLFPIPQNRHNSFPNHGQLLGGGSCSLDSMVVFGDSLSDIGTRQFFPPCQQGSDVTGVHCFRYRTTNGPLLVDYLAAYYNLSPLLQVGFPGVPYATVERGGSNFARSAAVARSPLGAGTDATFHSQVRNYKMAMGLQEPPAFLAPGFAPNLSPSTPTRLHVVWFGSNDIQDAVVTFINNALLLQNQEQQAAAGVEGAPVQQPPFTPQDLIDAGIQGMMNQLQDLLQLPNVCNVLVLGPIDASIVPSVVMIDAFFNLAFGMNVVQTARDYSEWFNDKLESRIITELMSPFQTKCQPTTSSSSGGNSQPHHQNFGITFLNTVNMMDTLFVKQPPPSNQKNNQQYFYAEPSLPCNIRFQTTGAQCSATMAKLSSTLSSSSSSSSSSRTTTASIPIGHAVVVCPVPVVSNEGLDCDCGGSLFFDEIHPSGEFHQAIFPYVLDGIGRVCGGR